VSSAKDSEDSLISCLISTSSGSSFFYCKTATDLDLGRKGSEAFLLFFILETIFF